MTDPLNRTTTFNTDSLGRTIAVQDALGRLSRTSYDPRDLVFQSVDPMNQATNYTYDASSNLLSVTDPKGGKTQYAYDSRNRKTSRTDALNQSESWTYDGLSNALTYTDRKLQITHYQYDALDRRTLTTYADSSTDTAIYDAGNRLTQLVDSISGTIVHTFDSLDRLTQEQTPQGTISYQYDAANRRTQMTPASQLPVTYSYDNANRLTQITQSTETVGIAYDTANRRTTLTLPNGIVTSYTYDNANEITGITYTTSGNTQLAALAYSYDLDGERISETGGFAADALPTATTASGVFDLNNRQTSANGFAISYDTDGDPQTNNAATPAQTYTFDARHRLTQIQQGGSTLASFQYDPLGRRTSKTISGTTTTFLYDGENAVQETQGAMANSILTGLGIDERFARTETAGRYYFLSDALGSTLALTNASATVQQTYAYEPFGQVTATGTSNNPYQYTGRENDGTGLHYYHARYYSPILKHFISEDPMGLAAGLNSYAYANGNPVSNTDPLGLDCTSANGTTTCGYPGGPTFSIPTPPGFPPYFGPDNLLYHHYDVVVPAKHCNPQDVRNGLANHPAPGNSSPATPDGTPNVATAFGINNPILSYSINDSNGNPIVVNVTTSSGGFSPGYVARQYSNGNVHNYGEGNNWMQSPYLWGQGMEDYFNNSVWVPQTNQILSGCGCGE